MEATGYIAAVVSALTALIGSVSGVVGAYLVMRHRHRIELAEHQVAIETTVTDHYRAFIEGQRQELELHRQNAANLAKAFREIQQEYTQTLVTLARIYGYLEEQHRHSERAIAALKKMGVEIDPGPSLPSSPFDREEESRRNARMDAITRTIEQTSRTIQQIQQVQQATPALPTEGRKRPSDNVKVTTPT